MKKNFSTLFVVVFLVGISPSICDASGTEKDPDYTVSPLLEWKLQGKFKEEMANWYDVKFVSFITQKESYLFLKIAFLEDNSLRLSLLGGSVDGEDNEKMLNACKIKLCSDPEKQKNFQDNMFLTQ